MGLKYADLCKNCGEHKTIDASGICAVCRRKKEVGKKTRRPCKNCGRQFTRNEDGLFSTCRQGFARTDYDYEGRLIWAIEQAKNTQRILELRLDGNSFAKFAEMTGFPVIHVYRSFEDAMEWKSKDRRIDYVDGEVNFYRGVKGHHLTNHL